MLRRWAICCLSLFGACLISPALQADDEKIYLPALLQEQTVEFTVSSRRNSYHCDLVRAETLALLRQMGATDIEVSCAGGLPYERDNFVTAHFVSIRQTTNEKSTRIAALTPVRLQFNSACELREIVIENVLQGFETFDFVSAGNCRGSRGSVDYQFKTLF